VIVRACVRACVHGSYAETPPDLDVDGIDTAHKLSLVSAVSNGCLVHGMRIIIPAVCLSAALAAV
jgi:homoserine dehydrogenase